MTVSARLHCTWVSTSCLQPESYPWLFILFLCAVFGSPCACALAEPAHEKAVWNKMGNIFIIAEYSTGNKPVLILERYFSKMTLWNDLVSTTHHSHRCKRCVEATSLITLEAAASYSTSRALPRSSLTATNNSLIWQMVIILPCPGSRGQLCVSCWRPGHAQPRPWKAAEWKQTTSCGVKRLHTCSELFSAFSMTTVHRKFFSGIMAFKISEVVGTFSVGRVILKY